MSECTLQDCSDANCRITANANCRMAVNAHRRIEANYEIKLSKAILHYQIDYMQRQQEAGILNCAQCIIQELKFTLYSMKDE
jgi:hypothetical protein